MHDFQQLSSIISGQTNKKDPPQKAMIVALSQSTACKKTPVEYFKLMQKSIEVFCTRSCPHNNRRLPPTRTWQEMQLSLWLFLPDFNKKWNFHFGLSSDAVISLTFMYVRNMVWKSSACKCPRKTFSGALIVPPPLHHMRKLKQILLLFATSCGICLSEMTNLLSTVRCATETSRTSIL